MFLKSKVYINELIKKNKKDTTKVAGIGLMTRSITEEFRTVLDSLTDLHLLTGASYFIL